MTSNKRIAAERLGKRAEWFAAFALLLKGYRIVARRYKTKVGEIDLIARRGDLVAMVEVKARPSVQQAVDAVSYASQRRINNAADLWHARQPDAAKLSIRFDIIAVCPRKWPVHLEDAF
ncbi:MAG: YraN family protein [Rhizobiaceae bacterium]|nr:YraN family protein [Rhizobiaceae bacterium]